MDPHKFKAPIQCLHCDVLLHTIQEVSDHRSFHEDMNLQCHCCLVRFDATKMIFAHMNQKGTHLRKPVDVHCACLHDGFAITVYFFCCRIAFISTGSTANSDDIWYIIGSAHLSYTHRWFISGPANANHSYTNSCAGKPWHRHIYLVRYCTISA